MFAATTDQRLYGTVFEFRHQFANPNDVPQRFSWGFIFVGLGCARQGLGLQIIRQLADFMEHALKTRKIGSPIEAVSLDQLKQFTKNGNLRDLDSSLKSKLLSGKAGQLSW